MSPSHVLAQVSIYELLKTLKHNPNAQKVT